jgi:peroxiredoxin
MNRCAIVVLSAFALAAPVAAGKFNEKLSVGDPAPDFNGLPGTDGLSHALGDFKGKDAVVVVFTCNSCPVAEEYEDRIIALARKYGDRVGFIAVNANNTPADMPERMKEKAKEKGFPYPYVHDATQATARAYGATYTPEFVLLDRDRKVAYLGALDDKSKADEAKERYLEAAIEAVLKGEKPATAETLARGCKVRYDRKKR